MAYQPIEPVGLGRNVANEMMKGGPRLQQEIKTMGPDTIKMIALQQIADQEKQRAMQANMQAQVNPATIMQQVEQEVMQMGQPQQAMGLPAMQGKVQQVGGALAQKQRMQQKNMQRAGQAPQRPMQAPQPRPQQPPVRAAMGGLMTQAAPNIHPRYFEGGGIVAFAQGKEVRGYFDGGAIAKKLGISLEELERRIADQESRGLPREKAEQAMEQAAAVPSARKDFSMTEAYRQKLGMPEKEEVKKELTGTTEFPESPMLGNVGGAPKGLAGLMPGVNLPEKLPSVDDRTKKVFEGLPEEEVEVEETERVYAQLPAFEGAELPDSAKSTAPDKSKLAEGIASLRGADPTTQRDEASKYYKENMALDSEIQEEMDLMARRTREREEGYKPSRATTIREALAGAANRGSLGSVGAGISGAMSAREGDIQKRRDDLFKDRQNSLDKLVARSDSIASGALTYGQTEKESAKQDIRSALNAELGIFQSESADFRAAQQREAQVVIANASNEVRTNIANLTAKVQQQTNDALNSFRENSLTAEDTKSQRSLMGTLVAAKQRAEASIATAVAKLTSDVAFAAPPEDYEGTPEEYRKEVVSSAITGLAASLAPLDAMIAEFGENLGIDIPEPAVAAAAASGVGFSSLPK